MAAGGDATLASCRTCSVDPLGVTAKRLLLGRLLLLLVILLSLLKLLLLLLQSLLLPKPLLVSR